MTDAPGWVTLGDGERVVWQGTPVVYHYLGGYLLAAALLVAGAGTVLAWPWPSLASRWVAGGAVAALGVLVGGQTVLSRRSVRYLVTTEEVYVRRGLLSRSVTSLRLDRVQNSSFDQTLAGRVLSYGDVTLDTAGGDEAEVVMENVADPEAVLSHVSEGMASSTPPFGAPASSAPSGS